MARDQSKISSISRFWRLLAVVFLLVVPILAGSFSVARADYGDDPHDYSEEEVLDFTISVQQWGYAYDTDGISLSDGIYRIDAVGSGLLYYNVFGLSTSVSCGVGTSNDSIELSTGTTTHGYFVISNDDDTATENRLCITSYLENGQSEEITITRVYERQVNAAENFLEAYEPVNMRGWGCGENFVYELNPTSAPFRVSLGVVEWYWPEIGDSGDTADYPVDEPVVTYTGQSSRFIRVRVGSEGPVEDIYPGEYFDFTEAAIYTIEACSNSAGPAILNITAYSGNVTPTPTPILTNTPTPTSPPMTVTAIPTGVACFVRTRVVDSEIGTRFTGNTGYYSIRWSWQFNEVPHTEDLFVIYVFGPDGAGFDTTSLRFITISNGQPWFYSSFYNMYVQQNTVFAIEYGYHYTDPTWPDYPDGVHGRSVRLEICPVSALQTPTVAATPTQTGEPLGTPSPTRTPSNTRTPTGVATLTNTPAPTWTRLPTITQPAQCVEIGPGTPRPLDCQIWDNQRTQIALEETRQAEATFIVPDPVDITPALTGPNSQTAIAIICDREPCHSIQTILDTFGGMANDFNNAGGPCSGIDIPFSSSGGFSIPQSAFNQGICWFVDLTTPVRGFLRMASAAFSGFMLFTYYRVLIRRLGDV